MTKCERIEKELSNWIGFPVWLVRKGRFYKVQRVDNSEYLEYFRFKNLDFVLEYVETLKNCKGGDM